MKALVIVGMIQISMKRLGSQKVPVDVCKLIDTNYSVWSNLEKHISRNDCTLPSEKQIPLKIYNQQSVKPYTALTTSFSSKHVKLKNSQPAAQNSKLTNMRQPPLLWAKIATINSETDKKETSTQHIRTEVDQFD